MKSKETVNIVKRLWSNYVVRNVVLLASLIVLFTLVASLLINLFTRHNVYRDVPDFSGLTVAEALELSKKERLRIEVGDSLYVAMRNPGIILEQRPAAGSKVKTGRRIFVTINSVRQRMVDVPYVADYSLRQAKNILEAAGLTIEKLIYVDYMGTNYVLRQHVGQTEVAKGRPMKAEYGSGVTLTVGRQAGAERVAMPRVVGLSLAGARSRLQELGFNVARTVNDAGVDSRNQSHARVYKQYPPQNEYEELGSQVTLYLTLDSLTIAQGMAATDAVVEAYSRKSVLRDSLTREGYSGQRLNAEVEWILKIENGEDISPEEISRHFEAIDNSEEGYADETIEMDYEI